MCWEVSHAQMALNSLRCGLCLENGSFLSYLGRFAWVIFGPFQSWSRRESEGLHEKSIKVHLGMPSHQEAFHLEFMRRRLRVWGIRVFDIWVYPTVLVIFRIMFVKASQGQVYTMT